MKIGMVGLGKMGFNMSRRLLQGGHEVVATDLNAARVAALAEEGGSGVADLDALVEALEQPRAVWIMVPSGGPTESTVDALVARLSAGDVIVDGGNSYYGDSLRRGEGASQREIHYVDVGTSGGVWGLTEGYSMMAGGADEAIALLRPALETLAPTPDEGWGHVGPTGAGHFVKMVHNGIEYGLMQAYAEGFELMQQKQDFALDLHQVAEIWRSGSVIRSWLLDLTARALDENATLEGIAAYVPDSGEGRWTVQESIDLNVPIPVITAALQRRFRSRQDEPFSDRLLSALRGQFGGHDVKKT